MGLGRVFGMWLKKGQYPTLGLVGGFVQEEELRMEVK